MSVLHKLRRQKNDKAPPGRNDDKNNSTPTFTNARGNTENKKTRQVVINRWNGWYYGFIGFGDTTPQKPKRVVVDSNDLLILKETNNALMRDHVYKDEEMKYLKQKYVMLKRKNRKLESQAKEWATEKKQLLEQLEKLGGNGTSMDETGQPKQKLKATDIKDHKESQEQEDNQLSRRPTLLSSPDSVKALVEKKEAKIRKRDEIQSHQSHDNDSERYKVGLFV